VASSSQGRLLWYAEGALRYQSTADAGTAFPLSGRSLDVPALGTRKAPTDLVVPEFTLEAQLVPLPPPAPRPSNPRLQVIAGLDFDGANWGATPADRFQPLYAEELAGVLVRRIPMLGMGALSIFVNHDAGEAATFAVFWRAFALASPVWTPASQRSVST